MARGNAARKVGESERFQDSAANRSGGVRGREDGAGVPDPDGPGEQGRSQPDPEASAGATLEENVEEIKRWELTTLNSRSPVEQLSDWIAAKAASPLVMLAHVLWFASWIAINLGWIPGVTP